MELAELAVKKALDMKVTEAEVYVQKVKAIYVEFTEEIESLKTVESIGMGLRVALGKKTALYSTSIRSEDEVSEVAAKAVKIAKVASEDPHWKNINKKFSKSPAKGYYDETLENLDYKEIVSTLNLAIKCMKSVDKRVNPTRGYLSALISDTSIANSYNEKSERKETGVAVWMRTKAEEAGVKSTGTEHQQARFWKEINFEDLATKSAEKAVKFLKAKPIPSERMPIIIRNQIFANILGVILSGPINADWVQQGRSPLSNKLGTHVSSENISIYDDGTMYGGWQTKPFDDEGHPTQRTSVIEKGMLRNYLYDTYTALKDNVESTGNARRYFYWVGPQPLPSNLILRPGKTSSEEIVLDTKRGIYVEETIGEWLSNPVSGNLNATVTHGYLIKNGELTEPIKGVVISGNFYEILKNRIEIVGNDLKNSAQNYSPTVKITQLTVAGK